MPKFEFTDRQGFIETVSRLFESEQEVGEMAASIMEVSEGNKAQDVLCALSFMVAFIIDSSDDKRETLDEFVRVTSRFIRFDKPAFREGGGYSPMQ